MKKIILASNSPRRKEILSSLKLDFTVKAPNFDETSINESVPKELCRKIARGKALSVLEILKKPDCEIQKNIENSIILAADTLVFSGDKVFGKPKDELEARAMLKSLSGSKHSVVTAICCIDFASENILERQALSYVYFKEMSSGELNFYLSTGEWNGVAGAYKIQDRAAFFIERIEGSYSNIVGLPIHELYEVLCILGFEF